MKKLKPTSQPRLANRKITLSFKVNAKEMKSILTKTHGYTNGNVSEWIRYAVLNFKPQLEDFQK